MAARPPYDLIVVTLTSTSGHYARRLEAFARYGLVNVRGRRVKHVMLHSGPPVPQDLLQRWPCEYEIMTHAAGEVNLKISGFFADRGAPLLEQARWIGKWDDDSVTDIDGLIRNLDLEYNWDDPLYLMADHVAGVDDPTRQVIRTLGYHRWIRRSAHAKFHISHEWEGSVISNEGLCRVVNSADAIRFLRLCTTIGRHAFGDQSLAIAARIAKVHPIDCPFMTKDDAWEDLTLFGGRHAHVHYLAPDKGERWNQFVSHYEQWVSRGSRLRPVLTPRLSAAGSR